jgi:sulfite exporter TauE/SafE
MLATSLVGKFIKGGLRSRMNKLIPVFAIVLAIIFILRGLSLGIPFLSPPEKKLHVPATVENAEGNCCSEPTI